MDHPMEDLCRAVLHQNIVCTSRDEKAVMDNMRRRMYMMAAQRLKALEYRSKMEVIDEQSNITRLRYLLCLKDLRIDEALVLKRHMLELEDDRKRLAMLLGDLLPDGVQ